MFPLRLFCTVLLCILAAIVYDRFEGAIQNMVGQLTAIVRLAYPVLVHLHRQMYHHSAFHASQQILRWGSKVLRAVGTKLEDSVSEAVVDNARGAAKSVQLLIMTLYELLIRLWQIFASLNRVLSSLQWVLALGIGKDYATGIILTARIVMGLFAFQTYRYFVRLVATSAAILGGVICLFV